MSRYPYTRIAHWKSVEGYTHSKILAENLSYDDALALETSEAKAKGCKSNPGGERTNTKDWSVYHVWDGK
jgi:hypothetical protein